MYQAFGRGITAKSQNNVAVAGRRDDMTHHCSATRLVLVRSVTTFCREPSFGVRANAGHTRRASTEAILRALPPISRESRHAPKGTQHLLLAMFLSYISIAVESPNNLIRNKKNPSILRTPPAACRQAGRACTLPFWQAAGRNPSAACRFSCCDI